MAQQGSDGGNSQTPEQQNAREEAKRPAEELRQLNLTRMLTPEAKERLGQYALLKPNKARLFEDIILKHAEKGHIGSYLKPVVNELLISMLEKGITKVTEETKVRAYQEVEALWRRQLQELKAQRDGDTGNLQTPEQQKSQEQAKRAAEELRQLNLTQMLTPKAKERLDQYAQLKPKKARLLEDVLLKRTEKGIMPKVLNEWLISELEKIITTGNRLTPEQRKARAKRRAVELRQLNLTRILTPEAKERLSGTMNQLAQMALKQPIKTRVVEDVILKHAEKGVRTKLSDEKLISLLKTMDTIASARKLRSALEAMHI